MDTTTNTLTAAEAALQPSTLFRNGIYQTGLAAICLSLFLFLFFKAHTSVGAMPMQEGLFFINYIIAAFYFLTILITGKLRKKNGGIYFFFLYLILALISAYSLNRELNVFEDSVTWLCALLVLSCMNYVMITYLDKLPSRFYKLAGFVLAISLCVFFYLSFYLLPLYPISAAIGFILGLSLHTFIPLCFVIFTIKIVRRLAKQYPAVKRSFFFGLLACIAFTICFVARWSYTNNSLTKSYLQNEGNSLKIPAWVYASQHIYQNNFTEKVLKSGILYTIPSAFDVDGFFRFNPPAMSGEKTQHDPLIMTAALLSAPASIPAKERVNMLKVLADKRHATQERLWRGDDLETRHIKTVAQVWPRLHLAYTEKTVIIVNNNPGSFNRQEAIYTFALPEGSVVTALSLWINGKEEKALLTTKEKAELAYKTIVAVESRDPSVVHWQEGNTVSVRIFPVLGNDVRKFKIGVTTPLPVEGDNLTYNNIVFQGPATVNTTEDVEVKIEEPAKNTVSATSLSQDSDKRYIHSGQYNPGWSLSWRAEPVQQGVFNFSGNSYTIKPYALQRKAADIKYLYLDVNETWSQDEVEDVLKMAGNRLVYVYANGFKKVGQTNLAALYNELKTQHYSLFPFYLLTDVPGSVVITKSGEISASLHDLKGSEFYHHLKNFIAKDMANNQSNASFAGGEKIKLYNMGTNLSVYLRSLREMRIFDYEQGTTNDLKTLLQDKIFATDIENDSQVVLHDAHLIITKDSAAATPNAPDHVMRLFAYNHIMQKGGTKFLDKNIPEEDTLVQEAKVANIVTPLSSLVVLESAADYNRFDIHPADNSLYNASTGSSGSVPEPHEWALIIVSLLTILYLKRSNRMETLFAKNKS